MQGITGKLIALRHAGHTAWNEVENVKLRKSKYEEERMRVAGQMFEMLIRMKDIQTHAAYGNTGLSQTNGFVPMRNSSGSKPFLCETVPAREQALQNKSCEHKLCYNLLLQPNPTRPRLG